MYMLERASEIFPEASFAVAHCNFSLRGAESDGDEAFVQSRCESLGVKLFVRRFDTRVYAAEHGISIEMAARDLRYDWFLTLCREEGFDTLAVAHNANDNAETLILNLLRGTGLKGLQGMAGSSPRQGLSICRPLLGTPRSEILKWMTANGRAWREDSTNSSTDEAKRNMIRGEVFPIFSKINPSFLKTLGADIERFAQAGDILAEWCKEKAAVVMRPDGIIDADALRHEPHKAYLLWHLLEPYGINGSTLDSLLKLVDGKGQFAGKEFRTPTHRIITASGSRIIIAPLTDSAAAALCDDGRMTAASGSAALEVINGSALCDDGESGTPGGRTLSDNFRTGTTHRISTTIVERKKIESVKAPKGTLYADADKLPLPLKVRHWQDGDWLRPLGLHGRKKISDLFADLKWAKTEKENALVVELDGSHVGALLFERIDDSLKITDTTSKIIIIKEENL